MIIISEKEDERIARQLQQQLEIDEQRKLADLAKYDQVSRMINEWISTIL